MREILLFERFKYCKFVNFSRFSITWNERSVGKMLKTYLDFMGLALTIHVKFRNKIGIDAVRYQTDIIVRHISDHCVELVRVLLFAKFSKEA